jgi:hypothetical protein
MNGRGQYGSRLLYGGSLYSGPPHGGAPANSPASWVYRGPRAFHGHEAPTFGRGGLWKRRGEAPLGHGSLMVGEHARGQYDQRRARVGAALGLFHTVAERERARAQLQRDMDAVYQTLTRQILHATPEHPYGLASDATIRSDWMAWWKAKAVPFFNDFRDWSAERSPSNWTRFGGSIAYGAEWATDWDTYKRWRDQLITLRKEAEALGIRFQVSEPAPLPTTIVEDVEELAHKAVGGTEDAWKFVKYAAYGVLAIGTVVALSSVAQNLRAGKDPAEKYMALLRRRSPREAVL